jgi:hypothetical protein
VNALYQVAWFALVAIFPAILIDLIAVTARQERARA